MGALGYLTRFLSTSFRPLFTFWATSVLLMSLYQALNATSSHNIGVRIDPLAALMQEVTFQISVLFPNLGTILLSALYTFLQSLGIVTVFILLTLIYIPLRFLVWLFSVFYHDFIFAQVPKMVDDKGRSDESLVNQSPGSWIETPENSPQKENFEKNEEGKEKQTEREILLSTPRSKQQSEAGSERVDSVMRGQEEGEEGVSNSRFSGISPEFRSAYTQEE